LIRVAVLGASGSIGLQALDVIDRYPDRFETFALVTGRRRLARPARFSLAAEDVNFDERLDEIVSHPDCDVVLVAIPGARALRPTLAALRARKKVALATKEVMVMAGALVTQLAHGDAIRPVDSEHSAIWQCLWGEAPESIARLVLTASGGPFWSRAALDLSEVTVAEALAHPRWSMGPKVTVDSATLMNKGLELIEAHHIFQVPLGRIGVVIHPQSLIHSLVEFVDGSAKAQISNPDMRLPIALALGYPLRLPRAVPPTPYEHLGALELHPLDDRRFPAVSLARRAAEMGPPFPAVLNAANEEAVTAFLAGSARFTDILVWVESALERYERDGGRGSSLEVILEADRWAREYVRSRLGTYRL
jgi:1-deoxy-D-xylulose-5-phosphate reductoisomerase